MQTWLDKIDFTGNKEIKEIVSNIRKWHYI